MLRPVFLVWLTALALCGQTSQPGRVQTPNLGLVRLSDGSVRAVQGLPGSFVLGPALFRKADSVSFSGQAGLVALPDRLVLLNQDLSTLAVQPLSHPALTGVSGDTETAIAWIADEQTLLFWNGHSFDSSTPQGLPPGTVWSVERHGNTAILLVNDLENDFAVTVSLESGVLLDCHVTPSSPRRQWSEPLHQKPADLTLEQMNAHDFHVLSRTQTLTWVVNPSSKNHAWELPAAKEMQ